jgi:hypothetical protein
MPAEGDMMVTGVSLFNEQRNICRVCNEAAMIWNMQSQKKKTEASQCLLAVVDRKMERKKEFSHRKLSERVFKEKNEQM